jgi:mono/diheme cytochrome c family protein
VWLTNLKVVGVTLAVVGFYTLVARAIPQLESDVPADLALGVEVTSDELVAAGERVFNGAGGCTACHGLGTRAPNLLTDHSGEGPIGQRCGTRAPGRDCKAYLYEALTDPGAYVVQGFEDIMPDMRRQLPEDQVWATIAFLQAQGGAVTVTAADLPTDRTAAPAGPAPTPATATVDPPTLLQELGCVACHALDGQGPAIGPSFDGIGGRASADRIRRGIVDPGAEVAEGYEQVAGLMPQTFGNQLSAAQLEILVAFLAERR